LGVQGNQLLEQINWSGKVGVSEQDDLCYIALCFCKEDDQPREGEKKEQWAALPLKVSSSI